MDFGQKKFHEIDLFNFTSFFGLDFFKFSGPLWHLKPNPRFWVPNPSLLEPSSSSSVFRNNKSFAIFGDYDKLSKDTEKKEQSFQFVEDFIAFMEETCWILHNFYVEENFIGMFNPFVRFAEQKLSNRIASESSEI